MFSFEIRCIDNTPQKPPKHFRNIFVMFIGIFYIISVYMSMFIYAFEHYNSRSKHHNSNYLFHFRKVFVIPLISASSPCRIRRFQIILFKYLFCPILRNVKRLPLTFCIQRLLSKIQAILHFS